jgi:UDP-N-acetylmuramoylalanine--D-glutamate ligase
MTAQTFTGKKILVMGLGLSGQSAACFLLRRGAKVTGVDRNPQLKIDDKILELQNQGMTFVLESDVKNLYGYDLIIVSPGISPKHFLYHQALQSGIEVIGEIELACREIRQPCLAVTGTNGKTTVTLMTEHILQKAGIKAKSLGNVGLPLTSALDETVSDETVFVIELSSFQLETLSARFIDAGVILNITPDHLDRYPSMREYAAAKIGIRKNLKDNGILFIQEKCLKDFCELFNPKKVVLGNKLMKDFEFKSFPIGSENSQRVKAAASMGSDYSSKDCVNLLPLTAAFKFNGELNQKYGYSRDSYISTDLENIYYNQKKVFSLPEQYRGKRSHDLENIMAAFALCSSQSITSEEFLNGLASFQKPAHRIEFVGTIDGVSFFDDSKGTNIDAVIRAVEALQGQVVLIAGGVDKGFPYTSWVEAFKGKVKAICAIGQSKEKIKRDLENEIPVTLFSEFKQAVIHAACLAKKGDHVLLSPGCSSFDMFKDYAHRGQEFQRIIKENLE